MTYYGTRPFARQTQAKAYNLMMEAAINALEGENVPLYDIAYAARAVEWDLRSMYEEKSKTRKRLLGW